MRQPAVVAGESWDLAAKTKTRSAARKIREWVLLRHAIKIPAASTIHARAESRWSGGPGRLAARAPADVGGPNKSPGNPRSRKRRSKLPLTAACSFRGYPSGGCVSALLSSPSPAERAARAHALYPEATDDPAGAANFLQRARSIRRQRGSNRRARTDSHFTTGRSWSPVVAASACTERINSQIPRQAAGVREVKPESRWSAS